MRLKTIFLSLTALLMVGAGFFVWNNQSEKPFYVIYPEGAAAEEGEEDKKGKIKAAMQYFHGAKADLYTGKVNSEAVMEVYRQLDNFDNAPSSRSKLGSW